VDFKLGTLRLGVIKGRVLASAPAPPSKKPASLSLTLSTQTVRVGDQVTISGKISPSLSGEVSILILRHPLRGGRKGGPEGWGVHI
jgi:hypothetical protein